MSNNHHKSQLNIAKEYPSDQVRNQHKHQLSKKVLDENKTTTIIRYLYF